MLVRSSSDIGSTGTEACDVCNGAAGSGFGTSATEGRLFACSFEFRRRLDTALLLEPHCRDVLVLRPSPPRSFVPSHEGRKIVGRFKMKTSFHESTTLYAKYLYFLVLAQVLVLHWLRCCTPIPCLVLARVLVHWLLCCGPNPRAFVPKLRTMFWNAPTKFVRSPNCRNLAIHARRVLSFVIEMGFGKVP